MLPVPGDLVGRIGHVIVTAARPNSLAGVIRCSINRFINEHIVKFVR